MQSETTFALYNGDCLNVMPGFPENFFDSIVTDPPYGLTVGKTKYIGESTGVGFMGNKWDHGVPGIEFWKAALRVTKPGAYLVAFGGSRTFHRLMVAIEDAGWNIRDTIMWVNSSGFPKSLNVARSIDKKLGYSGTFGDYRTADHAIKRKPGNQRMHEGYQRPWRDNEELSDNNCRIYIPESDEAKKWIGWGSALKPAYEPIIIAQKPYSGTLTENIIKYGVGGINIDATRVPSDGSDVGRWPSNFIHDGSDDVLSLFPVHTTKGSVVRNNKVNPYASDRTWHTSKTQAQVGRGYSDTGSAARFFYCAKASKKDRDEGVDLRIEREGRQCYDPAYHIGGGKLPARVGNHHPTVKPTELLAYLCTMFTPVGGTILDPFMGSGSTGKAAAITGFSFVGIEIEQDYIDIAQQRIDYEIAKRTS